MVSSILKILRNLNLNRVFEWLKIKTKIYEFLGLIWNFNHKIYIF